MQIALLTRFQNAGDGSSFVTRLDEESQRLGHQFVFLNPREVAVSLHGQNPQIFNGKTPLHVPDVFHYALRWDDQHGFEIVSAFESFNTCKVLPSVRAPLGDSITMARLFTREGLTPPKAWVLADPSQISLMQNELTYPCLIKVRRGAQGRQAYVAQHVGEVERVAEKLALEGYSFMLQPVVGPVGEDVRAFVLGDAVAAAVSRTAPEGYLRPLEEGNSRITPTTLSEYERQTVCKIAKLYGAAYAAVDFVRTENGPSLVEVVRTPSFEETEQTTQINVAYHVVQYLTKLKTG